MFSEEKNYSKKSLEPNNGKEDWVNIAVLTQSINKKIIKLIIKQYIGIFNKNRSGVL